MNSLVTLCASYTSIMASLIDDFKARVRAEAQQRLEKARFEKAVKEEMLRIEEEEWLSAQKSQYHAFHEKRKARLLDGTTYCPFAQIEVAVSDFALGNLTEEQVVEVVKRFDHANQYVWGYAVSPKGRLANGSEYIKQDELAPSGLHKAFRNYLMRAKGYFEMTGYFGEEYGDCSAQSNINSFVVYSNFP